MRTEGKRRERIGQASHRRLPRFNTATPLGPVEKGGRGKKGRAEHYTSLIDAAGVEGFGGADMWKGGKKKGKKKERRRAVIHLITPSGEGLPHGQLGKREKGKTICLQRTFLISLRGIKWPPGRRKPPKKKRGYAASLPAAGVRPPVELISAVQ